MVRNAVVANRRDRRLEARGGRSFARRVYGSVLNGIVERD